MAHGYYAIERSPDYLAHYGVKGMKWGVRKALERGNRAALSAHYRKASQKLAKLSLRANRDYQQTRFNNAKSRMAGGALSSAVTSAAIGGLTSHGLNGLRGPALAKTVGLSALGGAAGGAIMNSSGITSKRFTTNRGHAKAVAQRDAWNKQMTEVFKDTPYGTKHYKRQQREIMKLSDIKQPGGHSLIRDSRQEVRDSERAAKARRAADRQAMRVASKNPLNVGIGLAQNGGINALSIGYYGNALKRKKRR